MDFIPFSIRQKLLTLSVFWALALPWLGFLMYFASTFQLPAGTDPRVAQYLAQNSPLFYGFIFFGGALLYFFVPLVLEMWHFVFRILFIFLALYFFIQTVASIPIIMQGGLLDNSRAAQAMGATIVNSIYMTIYVLGLIVSLAIFAGLSMDGEYIRLSIEKAKKLFGFYFIVGGMLTLFIGLFLPYSSLVPTNIVGWGLFILLTIKALQPEQGVNFNFVSNLFSNPPKQEEMEGDDSLQLGKNLYISPENRETHMYTVGKTGSGKSRAMQSWLTQDIEAGRGCAFIDAHGDVFEGYLASLAQKFIDKKVRLNEIEKQPIMEKLIIVDPTDPDYAVGINPLETHGIFLPTQIGDMLSDAIKKMWGLNREEAGRMEEILANTGYVLAKNGLTLIEASLFLNDEGFTKFHEKTRSTNEFRNALLRNEENVTVKDFWDKVYPNLAKQEELVDPGKRRIRKFISDERLAAMIGQTEKTLNFRKLMDDQMAVLCKLPVGALLDKGNFFGALLVSMFQQAAMSRDPSDTYPPFYLYIDEFQEFVSLAFTKILTGARKFGLCFVLAHQYEKQVDQEIQDAIFNNVKAMIAFKVGAENAEILSKEFFTVTGKMIKDKKRNLKIVNVGEYHIPYIEETPEYFNLADEVKMNATAFTKLVKRQFLVIQEGYEIPKGDITLDVPTIPKNELVKEYVKKIKEISNKRWAKPRSEIMKEIAQRQGKVETNPFYRSDFLGGKNANDKTTKTDTS